MEMWRIGVAGATGRMGKMVIRALQDAPDLEFGAALSRQGTRAMGTSATAFLNWETDVEIDDDIERALDKIDCLIDFSTPDATCHYLEPCLRHGTAMVIGTTGQDAETLAKIQAASAHIPIVHAANLSPTVFVMARMLEMAAALLRDYDVEIVESHNRGKVDAPSGSALWFSEVVAAARGYPRGDIVVYGRDAQAGPRKQGTVGIASVRGGNLVSEHTALLIGDLERIEIRHICDDRAVYAYGSLQAARFLRNRKAGLYSVADIAVSA
ncbi:4-hydroxy-tetrahydrodipicolinate reductase [Paraburkholderia ferrariae]|uniref:4-hydroxy-tetrahydrodipicolinate reductase n=1 Tax=Paraburkholderia ferrariae TaxID=386056 RepID=UPI000487F24F|nr:4-hydroxy-tetrahydrodipicolinate reductase [Paraburkholderia ferrariae]